MSVSTERTGPIPTDHTERTRSGLMVVVPLSPKNGRLASDLTTEVNRLLQVKNPHLAGPFVQAPHLDIIVARGLEPDFEGSPEEGRKRFRRVASAAVPAVKEAVAGFSPFSVILGKIAVRSDATIAEAQTGIETMTKLRGGIAEALGSIIGAEPSYKPMVHATMHRYVSDGVGLLVADIADATMEAVEGLGNGFPFEQMVDGVELRREPQPYTLTPIDGIGPIAFGRP